MSLQSLINQHKSPVFIATVLDNGDILQTANDAGYAWVAGVTTSTEDADHCRRRFAGHERVRIFHGEDIVLQEVIKDVNVTVTICLDARSEPPPALIQELCVLKHHRIKSHCIIIRNTSLFGQKESGFITLDQVKNAVKEIDSGYRFVQYDDIMVCLYH